MTPLEVLRRAREELIELGPMPADEAALNSWREEGRGAAVLLAALADSDGSVLRRAPLAATGDGTVRALLVDAIGECDSARDR